MTSSFAAFEAELQNDVPMQVGDWLLPKIDADTLEEKLQVMQNFLRRSLEVNDRMSALVNAFYLGKLLHQAENISRKFGLKRTLTRHYATIAEYTYDIFEPNPYQILQTISMHVQAIKKLRRRQVLQLRRIVERNILLADFAGAQSLEEEIVTGDPTAA